MSTIFNITNMAFFSSAEVTPQYKECATIQKENSTIEVEVFFNDTRIFNAEFGCLNQFTEEQYKSFLADDSGQLEYEDESITLVKEGSKTRLYIAKCDGDGFGDATFTFQTNVIASAIKAYINLQ